MSERNGSVAFPFKEILPKGLDLETYLYKKVKNGELFNYGELPGSISARSAEVYANWLLELSMNDLEYFERGAICHYDQRRDELVFPSNPAVGDKYSVDPIHPQHPLCTSVMVSHSHPDKSIFSGPWGGDLEYMFEENKYFTCGYVPVFQVSSVDRNYILLRTNETSVLDTAEWGWGMDGIWDDDSIKEISEDIGYDNQYGTGLSQEKFRKLIWRSGINLENPTSFDRFFHSVYFLTLQNFFVAKKYNLGLYFSEKDGLYKRYTSEEVGNYLSGKIKQKLDKIETYLYEKKRV